MTDKKPKKRKRRKKPQYPGELGKRISPGRYLADMRISDLMLQSFYKPIANINFLKIELATESKKLLLLMDHFGIDRDDKNEDRWLLLAFALARNHVPAFQNATKLGAPKKKNYDPLKLYIDVRNLTKEWGGRHTTNAAIKIVHNRDYPDFACKTVAGWFYGFEKFGDACLRDWKEEENREKHQK